MPSIITKYKIYFNSHIRNIQKLPPQGNIQILSQYFYYNYIRKPLSITITFLVIRTNALKIASHYVSIVVLSNVTYHIQQSSKNTFIYKQTENVPMSFYVQHSIPKAATISNAQNQPVSAISQSPRNGDQLVSTAISQSPRNVILYFFCSGTAVRSSSSSEVPLRLGFAPGLRGLGNGTRFFHRAHPGNLSAGQ